MALALVTAAAAFELAGGPQGRVVVTGAEVVLFAFWCSVGLAVGSFANVCIHRLPRGESVISPPSRCPTCGSGIAPWDNVPVLSWLLLRGRCRRCSAPIAARYPLVEVTVGAAFALAYLLYGLSLTAITFSLLSAASLILVATDLEHRVLPDEVTLTGLLAGLALAGGRDLVSFRSEGRLHLLHSHLLEAVGGAALGAFLLWAAQRAYRLLEGADGMGDGDITMIGMIGAFTGPTGVLLTLFFAALSGSLLGGFALVRRRLSWWRVLTSARAGRLSPERAAREGLLVGEPGVVLACGGRYAEIPDAPPAGADLRHATGVVRPLAAFCRLALARARRGRESEVPRLHLDDGEDFFRVLAARAARVGEEKLLVMLSRTDIPFGVFLGFGAMGAFLFGRAYLAWLFGGLWVVGGRLLP